MSLSWHGIAAAIGRIRLTTRHLVKFEPVTSVPYWDERCGRRFSDIQEFQLLWNEFWELAEAKSFRPRDYVLENLTLEKCAPEYLSIVQQLRTRLQ
jgi:hypothetical protein